MEWLHSVLPAESYYNITLFFSVLSCEELWPDLSEVPDEKDSVESIVEIVHGKDGEKGLFETIVNLFSTSEMKDDQRSNFNDQDSEPITLYLQDNCQSILYFNSNQNISFVYLALIGAVSIALTFVALTWLVSKLRKSKHETLGNIQTHHDILVAETVEPVISNNTSVPSDIESKEGKHSDTVNKNQLVLPLLIDIQKVNIQQFENIVHYPRLGSVLEETVDIFIKELDHSLGMELYLPSEGGNFGTSLPTSSSYNATSLASPLLARRGLRRNRHSALSVTTSNSSQEKISETPSRYWIYFQKFRRQMSWVYPDVNFDYVNFEQLSQTQNGLYSIIQFLHQRCSIRPKQWNAATYVVDYTLFLLECELTALSLESGGFLKFTGFEGTGCAVNGTLAGTVDRFDVQLVIHISNCSEISILHNKFYKDVPPGHIILGVKDVGYSKETIKCSRKACIQGISGFYLLPQQVEELFEVLVKKAVLKLQREHKSKTDRLPFKFQMSPNKKFVINFDTRLLRELGLGVGEISVKLIPAISIFVPLFGILPPLFAVPPCRKGHKNGQESNSASNNFLSRIIREQSHTDLIWEIDTGKLQTSIIQNIESKFLLSGVRSYHRECLIILKALFSKASEDNLLNKGEIDACILDNVVSFLLQESPPSAWTLDNLSERISDAAHFLKSAYQNRWLPKFVIHNPHLVAQIPSLEAMSSLLSGRQQNMLVDVTSDAALKVVNYIDQRLQETGLNKCMKAEFSSHMWEYEFFLFG